MSDAFAEMMLGHLVCLVQGNAFILVEWAYLGKENCAGRFCGQSCCVWGSWACHCNRNVIFQCAERPAQCAVPFVTAQLFGGTFADKLTACLINGTMCLLVENTVNYTYPGSQECAPAKHGSTPAA